jgi:hypothetical protein
MGEVSITILRGDSSTTAEVSNCLQRAVDRHERNYSGAALVGNETVWHVPAAKFKAEFAGEELRQGDLIAQGNHQWVIIDASLQTLKTRWRCICNDVDER